MTFTILTLFPDMVRTVLGTSMLARAAAAGVVQFDVQDLRQWGQGVHKSVDDTPYGGGAGMVLRIDVVDQAIADINAKRKTQNAKLATIILLTPQGKRFDQQRAEELAHANQDLILIVGHYEGFDERIRSLVDEEVSIGDFVLTGGELPALAVVDAVTRLLPGALGSDESVTEESFSRLPTTDYRLLEYPHYTRPEVYQPLSRKVGELAVPDVLRSGDHAKIAAWRQEQALTRTKERRPDLLG